MVIGYLKNSQLWFGFRLWRSADHSLTGDSGGPTVWIDRSSSDYKAYIVGVISRGGIDEIMCKIPANQQHSQATLHATVSKEVSEWIRKIVEKDGGDACPV